MEIPERYRMLGAVSDRDWMICSYCKKRYGILEANENWKKVQKYMEKIANDAKMFEEKSTTIFEKIFNRAKIKARKDRWDRERAIIETSKDGKTPLLPCNCAYNIYTRKTTAEQARNQLDNHVRDLKERANLPDIAEYPITNLTLKALYENPDPLKGKIKLRVCGDPETGKTTSVKMVARKAIEHGISVYYTTANKLAFLYKRPDEQAIRQHLESCAVVIIDDIGLDKAQSLTTEIWDTVKEGIDIRGQSLIILHNTTEKNLKEAFKKLDLKGKKIGAWERLINEFDEVIVEKSWK